MKPAILVVDDDKLNLQIMSKILGDNGYEVFKAVHAQEALSMLDNVQIDLIIMDVLMPETNGIQLSRIIHEKGKYSDIPVLFLSGVTEIETMVEGFNYGAVDYIIKPFNVKLLLTKLRTHLELKFQREEMRKLNQSLELKIAERTEKLEKAYRDLTRLDQMKTEFLGIISHEIRTPLNGILCAAQLIRNKIQNDDLVDLFDVLESSVKRLERFSMNALLITNLKSGKYQLRQQSISIGELYDLTLEMVHSEIADKGIRITREVFPRQLLHGDRELLIVCFLGILRNAIKFTPPESEVSLIVHVAGNRIEIEVQDEGEGFSQKALQHLYEFFAPGGSFINENEGIELALCKLIMDVHNGDIQIKNNKKGASVSLIFNNWSN